MPLLYLDSSALVKLLLTEPESDALRAYLADADLISSELVLVELPRAIARACASNPSLPRPLLRDRTGELVDALALVPLGRGILAAAGALDEPTLRALDAIHIASALTCTPLDALVSYDTRQAAAARLTGLRTITPAH